MKQILRKTTYIVLLFASVAVTACGPNERIMQSSAERSEPTPSGTRTENISTFDSDIEAMKNADFYLIYVFRRKDGAVLDADDRSFASATVPPEINRRIVSDQGKAIILGSNFKLPEDSMKAMTERFAMTDLSTKQLPESPKR
jgi:hypothetical protein